MLAPTLGSLPHRAPVLKCLANEREIPNRKAVAAWFVDSPDIPYRAVNAMPELILLRDSPQRLEPCPQTGVTHNTEASAALSPE